jgi:hypothetical protein
MESALGIGAPSQRFQNFDWWDISKAFRLFILAQNITVAALAITAVGMRGRNLRSVTPAMSTDENRNTFSEYAISRRRI